MIGLLIETMMGGMIRGALAGPCMLCAGVAAIFAICGCVKCMRCSMRDCACWKRILRTTGHDEFDDFELMMLVHEAVFERREAKLSTVVRVTAGRHSVRTDPSSNSIYQQPLHIMVEQGTENIAVELLDSRDRVLATLLLGVMDDVLQVGHQPEQIFTMKQKDKHIRHPRIKLTMDVQADDSDDDMEKGGLLIGGSSDVDSLVRLQLAKAREEGKALGGEGLSEFDVLKQACAGPLELFTSLGKTSNVYVSIVNAKRLVLGIWGDKRNFDAKKRPMQEVDLLRIQSVQSDPSRIHVFVINYFDESRVRQSFTFRRVDRGRDVWVEIIHLLVQKVRDARDNRRGKEGSKSRSLDNSRERGSAGQPHSRARGSSNH